MTLVFLLGCAYLCALLLERHPNKPAYGKMFAAYFASKQKKAVAHALLVIAFHRLKRKANYRELGADHFDRTDASRVRRSLVRRLERLGHKVTLEPLA